MTRVADVFPVICPSEGPGTGLAPACWPDQTIIAAIGDFGSDSRALAAARRNHVQLLMAAAVAAVLA
jgi:hypothetical protein